MKFYDRLLFVVPVFIAVGIVYCVRAYYAGGVSRLQVALGVWLAALIVVVLLNLSLRRFRRINR